MQRTREPSEKDPGSYRSEQDTGLRSDTCAGSFPDGYIATGETNCALCVADCYDGRRDLPDRNGYEEDFGATGPIQQEVLLNWKGTRLPTPRDFFGFCGSKDENDGTGDYLTDCDATTTLGQVGGQIGRTDECMDLSDTTYEWLAEKYGGNGAIRTIAGACSYTTYIAVDDEVTYFRAIFRP